MENILLHSLAYKNGNMLNILFYALTFIMNSIFSCGNKYSSIFVFWLMTIILLYGDVIIYYILLVAIGILPKFQLYR